MSEQFHDDDIEFDFFEDVDTREQAPDEQPRQPRSPGGPPRVPRRPSGPGLTPKVRLIGLIVFAVLVVILLVFVIFSCTGQSKKSSYKSYAQDMTTVASSSEKIGRDMDAALTTPGIQPNELATKLDGLADLQSQGIGDAQKIRPPGSLRNENDAALQSLSFRVSGLRRLADSFRATAGSEDSSGASQRLAKQAQRLVTSDVIWDDLFRAAVLAQMRSDGVSGIAVPDSNFVQNPDFGSSSYWQPVFERVNGAATSGGGGTSTGGLHGTGIVETKALPSGSVLSPTTENVITAGTNLGFAVVVEDTGDSQEVQVKVTLTIQQQPSPIVATRTIASINPGQQKTVNFTNLGQPQFATKTTVRVDVQPVKNEANADNNTASYPVIFSLG
jgi:hypothetical protein